MALGRGKEDAIGPNGGPEGDSNVYSTKVCNPYEPFLACEREGLVAALSLRDAENPVRTRIVDRNRALVVNHQPTGVGKNGVSKIILRADSARPCPIRRATSLQGVRLTGS